MSTTMNSPNENTTAAAIEDNQTVQADPSGASATANTHAASNASGQTDDGHNNDADTLPDLEDGVEASGQSDVSDDFSPLSSCRLTQVTRIPNSMPCSESASDCSIRWTTLPAGSYVTWADALSFVPISISNLWTARMSTRTSAEHFVPGNGS